MPLYQHKKKFIAGLAILAMTGLVFLLPLLIKPALETAIRSNGFPKANIGQVHFTPDGLFIDQISLDANEFSIVRDIEIRGEWNDLILRQTADRISIKSVELSGEIDQENRFILAGWDGHFNAGNGRNTAPALFKTLSIDGFIIDLDTKIGALRTQGKALIQSHDNGQYQFNASLWARQKQLTIALDISGLRSDKSLSFKADINEAAIDIPTLQLSRMNGWIEYKSGKPGLVSGQIMAGGMKIRSKPFEDINLVFDTSQKSKAVLNMRSVDNNLQLQAELDASIPAREKLKIDVTASTVGAILDFTTDTINKNWNNTGAVKIGLQTNLSELGNALVPFKLAMQMPKENISATSDFSYNRENKILSAHLPSTKIPAAAFSRLARLDEIFDISAGKGEITYAGSLSMNLSSPLKLAGPLDLKLSNIDGEILDYAFTGLSGQVKLTSVYPLQTAPDQKLSLSSLMAGKKLTDAKLVFDKGAENLKILSAQANLSGGSIGFEPFTWISTQPENKLTLTMKSVQLSKLISDTSSVKADGSISGQIPMTLSGNGIFIDNGKLRSDAPGWFKYQPEELPESLKGDDARMTTVRLALSDYRYNDLQVNLHGPLNGNLKTSLKANGTSPLFPKRQVNLNVNLEGALAAALRQALQPGSLADKIQQTLDGKQ